MPNNDNSTDTNAAGNAQQWPTNNPGTKPNANPDPSPHDNPDAVANAQLSPASNKAGGKQMGLVHAPVTSLNPTSQPQGVDANEKANFTMVTKANFKLSANANSDHKFKYPFEDIEAGDGMFIPVEKGGSTDQLMSTMYSQVDQYRKQNSSVELDENGDDVMEDVCINVKKRNDDGTVQLDGDRPRLTVRAGFRPKLLGPAFTVKAVVKGDEISDGDKADRDGVLVIRMA